MTALQTGDLQFLAELRPLPDEIDASHTGFYVQSMNRSDDVFMYLKKESFESEPVAAPALAIAIAVSAVATIAIGVYPRLLFELVAERFATFDLRLTNLSFDFADPGPEPSMHVPDGFIDAPVSV